MRRSATRVAYSKNETHANITVVVWNPQLIATCKVYATLGPHLVKRVLPGTNFSWSDDREGVIPCNAEGRTGWNSSKNAACRILCLCSQATKARYMTVLSRPADLSLWRHCKTDWHGVLFAPNMKYLPNVHTTKTKAKYRKVTFSLHAEYSKSSSDMLRHATTCCYHTPTC